VLNEVQKFGFQTFRNLAGVKTSGAKLRLTVNRSLALLGRSGGEGRANNELSESWRLPPTFARKHFKL
jgi:hypothetical protein